MNIPNSILKEDNFSKWLNFCIQIVSLEKGENLNNVSYFLKLKKNAFNILSRAHQKHERFLSDELLQAIFNCFISSLAKSNILNLNEEMVCIIFNFFTQMLSRKHELYIIENTLQLILNNFILTFNAYNQENLDLLQEVNLIFKKL